MIIFKICFKVEIVSGEKAVNQNITLKYLLFWETLYTVHKVKDMIVVVTLNKKDSAQQCTMHILLKACNRNWNVRNDSVGGMQIKILSNLLYFDTALWGSIVD